MPTASNVLGAAEDSLNKGAKPLHKASLEGSAAQKVPPQVGEGGAHRAAGEAAAPLRLAQEHKQTRTAPLIASLVKGRWHGNAVTEGLSVT